MSYQIGFGWSYAKMGRKMACDRPLFWALIIVSSCSVGSSDGTTGNSTQTTGATAVTQQGTSGHPPTAAAASSTPSSASQGSSEADKKQSTTILSSKCAKMKIVCIVYSRSLNGKQQSELKICTYSMAQNFDSGKYWQIRVGKILTSKKLTNASIFI